MDAETRLNELMDDWDRCSRERGATPAIETLCADCPELTDELRRRIAALAALDAMLTSGTSKFDHDGRDESPPAPDVVPAVSPFRPLSFHARGGLGEIHMARDEKLERDVALKVIQGSRADSRENRRRFEREVEITGRLEHPGIVPVYAAGLCEDGRPYYAMRFIRGETLGEAIRELHANSGTAGERAVAFRGLLNRFIQVCDTIAYAHDRGVLHRDVKPSNIILGSHGETVVVDWGLAKEIGAPDDEPSSDVVHPNDADLTVAGSAVGTPAFMAPEQMTGDRERLGPPSDIYSLGATLYALLTGRAAFDSADFGTLHDRVRRGDFPRPTQAQAGVPHLLEAVCLKAMALKPEDRYSSASALAREIEHWLADEPVSAYDEGALRRLARWARHHRPAVAASILSLVTVVVAMAIMTFQLAKAHGDTQQALRIAEADRTAARQSASEAEQARKRAVAHSFMILHGVTEPLKRLGNPDLERQPELAAMRRSALSQAELAYETFVKSRGPGPDESVEAINSLIHLGLIQTIGGGRTRALETYRRAIAQGDEAIIRNPDNAGAFDAVGMAHFNLGMDLRKLGRDAEAEEHFQAADARFVQGLQVQPELVGIRQHLAWLLAFCPDGRLRTPARAVKQALSTLELTEGQGRDRASFSEGIRPKFTEGLAYYRAGDMSAARSALNESVARRAGGDAYEWFVLAMVAARQGDLGAARLEYERAVEWTKWNRYGDTELHMLEAEAAVLIGRAPAFR